MLTVAANGYLKTQLRRAAGRTIYTFRLAEPVKRGDLKLSDCVAAFKAAGFPTFNWDKERQLISFTTQAEPVSA